MTRSAIAFAHGERTGVGNGIDTDPSGSLPEVAAVNGVTITEQVAWLVAPGRRLHQLAPDPSRRRVGRHVDVHQFAPAVGHKYEHIQRFERQGRYREQVSSPEVVGVVA
jgi:hypothetical protein